MKILVVDGLSTMRRITKKLLKDIGYKNVHEAKDGLEVINKLKTVQFDFLITAWELPNKSGLELLKDIRSEESLAKLPVLMVTAEAKREQIMAAIKAGVDGYIVKPFSGATLKDNIDKICLKRASTD